MKFFKVNAQPSQTASIVLPLLPFLVCIIAYSLTSYIRHDGIIPDWVSSIRSVLLFSTEKFQQGDLDHLDSGNISDGLQRGFEKNEISLSQNATVSSRVKGSRWRIIDEDNKGTYSVRKEKDKLNIYRNTMPYWITRIAGNPKDKLVPTVTALADGFRRTAFEPDRKGEYRLLVDTIASTRRFAIGIALLFLGVIFGLHMGVLPYTELSLYRFFLFFDKIPALAVLPILFIVFGLGEVSKIALIVIGVMPTIILDTYLRAKAVPRELITKAMTLNASDFEIMYRIVLPRIFPRVLETIRLNFKAVILFLIAGESLAATAGLGYRIFVVRRYVAMDIIIPYVLWISLLAFLADLTVRIWIKKKYPWLDKR